ncbi:nitrilase-related carbon-nitrogen hydrolase [Dokdonella sp.]|uniref:nitrilase-related carbon-nitrogen hydrolase n=1 Tax=Dokdonella sp. TaxID=2291710 RepID=UPI001B18F58C|nr:nitrilase-related carbon-nitrogen hydrolase [Dokdonella sp.]MBO9664069.1 hypothetical protein [Dokdonella sp.]
MDSRPDFAPAWAGAAAVALGAALWWLANDLQPAWWAAWLAPLPVLAYALRARARSAALATFLAFAIGGGVQWHYLHDVVRLPLTVTISAILVPAVLMLLVVLPFRALASRGRVVAATFFAPAAATGLAWLSATASPHGTFGHIAYSQMDALPAIQVAALLGLWGVGFVVWLLPSALAVLMCANAPAPRRASSTGLAVATLACALGYGALRLHDDGPTQSVRVGLVSIGASKEAQADLAKPEGERVLARYVEEIDRLAAAGAQIVVAPESALLVRSHAIPALQELSTRRDVRLLIGAEDHSDASVKRNAALVFEPGAAEPVAYAKRHLIPGFEDRYTPGDRTLLLDGTPRVGVAICKDLDFPSTGLAHGRDGSQLLLVPAWDFDEDAWLHGRMAVLRGVEGGFAMARVARSGLLTLSDDRGRVLAQASSVGSAEPATLLGELPLRTTRTLYARVGDAFGWLCLIAAAVTAASLLWRRKRRR